MKTKTHSSESQEGTKHVTATATKEPKVKGPKTPAQKNAEIKAEKAKGKNKVLHQKGQSWRKPEDGNVFLSGRDTGVLAWLTPVFCAFFGLTDCGYKQEFRIWNFPPDIDEPKKKHAITRQYFYKHEGKYVLVDVFNDDTDPKKITLIKAWMEKLGYSYTYIMGNDIQEGTDGDDFSQKVFVDRLKPLDEKSKDYPKFKIPRDYQEAKLNIGGVAYQKV